MMRWFPLMSLAVIATLSAPSVGASVDTGNLPDLPPAIRTRLVTLLDLKAGPLAGTGADTVDEALRQVHALSIDRQASTADRLAASATLTEARQLTNVLERARRCHRFFHEPKNHWALCCSLAGSGAAKTIDGASRLCLSLHTVGIAAPDTAPVLGFHYLHINNTLPLRPRNADGAALVYEDDPKVSTLRGKGWATVPHDTPVTAAARVEGGAPSVAAPPTVAVRQSEPDSILPIGCTLRGCPLRVPILFYQWLVDGLPRGCICSVGLLWMCVGEHCSWYCD